MILPLPINTSQLQLQNCGIAEVGGDFWKFPSPISPAQISIIWSRFLCTMSSQVLVVSKQGDSKASVNEQPVPVSPHGNIKRLQNGESETEFINLTVTCRLNLILLL